MRDAVKTGTGVEACPVSSSATLPSCPGVKHKNFDEAVNSFDATTGRDARKDANERPSVFIAS